MCDLGSCSDVEGPCLLVRGVQALRLCVAVLPLSLCPMGFMYHSSSEGGIPVQHTPKAAGCMARVGRAYWVSNVGCVADVQGTGAARCMCI